LELRGFKAHVDGANSVQYEGKTSVYKLHSPAIRSTEGMRNMR